MDVTVVVRDETTSGRVFGELALSLEAGRTTVRLIIEARVHAEVPRTTPARFSESSKV